MSWRMWIGPNEWIMPGEDPWKGPWTWRHTVAMVVGNVVFWGLVILAIVMYEMGRKP